MVRIGDISVTTKKDNNANKKISQSLFDKKVKVIHRLKYIFLSKKSELNCIVLKFKITEIFTCSLLN